MSNSTIYGGLQREPLVDPRNGMIRRQWFLLIQELINRSGSPVAAVSITLGASPASVTGSSFGRLVVSGGTVSLIEIGRGGVFLNAGVTAGSIPVSANDVVRITYTVAPTVSFLNT